MVDKLPSFVREYVWTGPQREGKLGSWRKIVLQAKLRRHKSKNILNMVRISAGKKKLTIRTRLLLNKKIKF